MPDAKKRLLVVEDHADTLHVLERLLTANGFEVRTAMTAADALDVARFQRFDLALVDVGLPDRDGCELMTELRDAYGMAGVALTGYGMESDVERCRQAGFQEHILKPFDINELIKVVTS